MRVYEATFACSCSRPSEFPRSEWPEIAFAGRSNVGKSSLLNLVLGRRGLAKVSGTPGKTQTINFFLVNRAYFFVDLPGYGYARVPRSVQRNWRSLIEAYLTGRPELRAVALLVDPRLPPTELDRTMHEWLSSYHIPEIVIATKADQVPRGRRRSAQDHIAAALSLSHDQAPVFVSARTGEGRLDLWSRIDDALALRPRRPVGRP
ncbi:MAG: ribosome biogenesis GTP-binding protein YihA/YsxC [Nitrospirota bacterium]